MLGFRGCRLAIVYPEIYEMQARAVFEAACDVAETGRGADPGNHDPVRDREAASSRSCKARVDAVAAEVFAQARAQSLSTWSAR